MINQPYQELDLCVHSVARYSEKCFTQIYRGLYGDAMLVPIHMGLSFAVKTNRKTFIFNLENDDVTFENLMFLGLRPCANCSVLRSKWRPRCRDSPALLQKFSCSN